MKLTSLAFQHDASLRELQEKQAAAVKHLEDINQKLTTAIALIAEKEKVTLVNLETTLALLSNTSTELKDVRVQLVLSAGEVAAGKIETHEAR